MELEPKTLDLDSDSDSDSNESYDSSEYTNDTNEINEFIRGAISDIKNGKKDTIDLECLEMNHNDMKYIADEMITNTSVKRLYLGDNLIGMSRNGYHGTIKGAQHIARILESNTTLETLYLTKNEFDDPSMIVIANALAKNTSLSTLYIDENRIGYDGICALARSLDKGQTQDTGQTNTTLVSLNVSNNDIKEKGVIALCSALESHPSIKNLYLCGNHIRDAGAIALAQLIKTNPNIAEIFVVNNEIERDGANAIVIALESIHHKINIHVDDDGFTPELKERIERLR